MLTVYFGLFFLTSKHREDESFDYAKDYTLGTSSKTFLFFMMVFTNAFFLIYWVYAVIVEVNKILLTKASNFYTKVLLCGRKELFDKIYFKFL